MDWIRTMLRLTEIKLPLDHAEEELRSSILKRLQIGDGDLLRVEIFKRSYDARKKGNRSEERRVGKEC